MSQNKLTNLVRKTKKISTIFFIIFMLFVVLLYFNASVFDNNANFQNNNIFTNILNREEKFQWPVNKNQMSQHYLADKVIFVPYFFEYNALDSRDPEFNKSLRFSGTIDNQKYLLEYILIQNAEGDLNQTINNYVRTKEFRVFDRLLPNPETVNNSQSEVSLFYSTKSPKTMHYQRYTKLDKSIYLTDLYIDSFDESKESTYINQLYVVSNKLKEINKI